MIALNAVTDLRHLLRHISVDSENGRGFGGYPPGGNFEK